jgi:hypothetical protein
MPHWHVLLECSGHEIYCQKRGMMHDILALISDRSLLRMASSVCWHGQEDR